MLSAYTTKISIKELPIELLSRTLKRNASSGAKVTLNSRLSFGLRHSLSGFMTKGKSASNHVSTLSLPVLSLNKVILLGSKNYKVTFIYVATMKFI